MNPPIITFAMPRSGSTLLMRLLNRCIDSEGKTVKYNGECDVLHHITAMYRKFDHQDINGVVSRDELEEDTVFLSHYHHLNTATIKAFIAEIMHVYCGGGSTWGWKNVNYGNDKKEFVKLLETTIKMYPEVRFIFLTRNYSDCLQSMLRCGYWEEYTDNEIAKKLSNQEAHFKAAIHLFTRRSLHIDYKQLLSYSHFKRVISELDLSIEEKQHDAIVKQKVVSCLKDASSNDQETHCSR